MGLKLILVGGPKLWRQGKRINEHGEPTTTLNVPISKGGANSSHKHVLVKSQSYWGLKILLSDPNFMTTVDSMLKYHRFQAISVCLWLVRITCLSVL